MLDHTRNRGRPQRLLRVFLELSVTAPERIPEQMERLLDTMRNRVQEQERELALFQKAAEDYRKKAEEFVSARCAEIARTQESIEVLEAELAVMRGFYKGSPPGEPVVPAGAIAGNASESERIRDAAREILREAGRPLMQREIKTKMDEIGFEIQSADPVELIRAALRRHRTEFRHVKGQGWALAGPDD
jgi:predicted ribosome quality control (RQC) complex YloA/Tae2 family protein